MPAAGTRVQLRLAERVVAEMAFEGAELRIGRMKENDLVINNLAVSRFHAVLRRVGDGFEIEDLGSENGTLVDGVAVRGTAAVPAGAAVTIGKHTLVLRVGGEATVQPPPKAAVRPPLAQPPKSDAWDAAQTYLVAGPAARAEQEEVVAVLVEPGSDDEGAPAALEAVEEAAAPLAAARAAPIAPEPPPQVTAEPVLAVSPEPVRAIDPVLPVDPEPLVLDQEVGALSFDEDDLVGEAAPDPVAVEATDVAIEPADLQALVAPSGPEVAASVAPPRPESGGQTALFDFGLTDDLGISDGSLERASQGRAAEASPKPDPEADAAAPAPQLAPEAAALHAGLIVERLGRVERVLPWADAELLAGRSPECGLVLPTSGVSRRHARFVREGDAFRVVDLGSANGLRVNGKQVESAVLAVGDVVTIDDFTVTFVLDREPVAAMGSAAKEPARDATRPGTLEPAPAAPARVAMTERDLVLEVDGESEPVDAEKELELAEALAAGELAAGWRFEIAVATERLPAALRRALAELGEDELRLPAELRLVRRA